MKANNNIIETPFDIVNNVITNENIQAKCIDAINSYKDDSTNAKNQTGLLRFARHITLENYFSKTNIDNSEANISNNIEAVIAELSFSADTSSKENDTVLLLQLSNTLDNFLSELSPIDKNIYLYRYFFAYCPEDIACLCNTQINSVQKILSQCNNKLNHLLNKNKLIADGKSLLLSFTDIDDSHLLSLIIEMSPNAENTTTIDSKNVKSKFTLKFCLNIVMGTLLTFLIILNIYQYINSIDKTSTDSSKNSNSQDINIDDFFIYNEDQKMVNINKLLEYGTYVTDEYPPFDFTIDNYTANYDAYLLPDHIPLSEFIGDEIPELAKNYAKYYKILGSDDYQYIIYKGKDDYVLFISGYLYATEDAVNKSYDTPIPLKESLVNFYGIDDASDIEEIRVMAGDSNTGYADCYTYKVIDYEEDIIRIYNRLIDSKFRANTIFKLFEEGIVDYDYLMDNSVQLYIDTKNTNPVDRIFYYPEGNFFFDFTSYLIYEIDYTLDNGYLYFQDLLRLNLHNEEPIDPELWLYSIRCTEADPTYLSFNIQCGPQANNIGKYVGSDYTIQKLDNNKWVDLPVKEEYANTAHFLFHQKLNPTSSATNLDIYSVDKYGYLQPGMYRLTLTIYDLNSEDINNPASKDYHMDFQIN